MKYKDKTKLLEDRKELYKAEIVDKRCNPIPAKDFDPKTFDPMADDTDEYLLGKRERKMPSGTLPTNGMLPKEILEGQTIGLYESKQDLYLLFANKINELEKRITDLENKK